MFKNKYALTLLIKVIKCSSSLNEYNPISFHLPVLIGIVVLMDDRDYLFDARRLLNHSRLRWLQLDHLCALLAWSIDLILLPRLWLVANLGLLLQQMEHPTT